VFSFVRTKCANKLSISRINFIINNQWIKKKTRMWNFR